MPVLITVENEKILLKIFRNTANFNEVVDALKKQHCHYNPDDHSWEIDPKRFERVHDALSEIDRIVLDEEDERKIDRLLTLPLQIVRTNEPVDRSTFKKAPMKGKAPYEDYQFEDIQTLFNTNRFALFNEQGTGKSYELITTIQLLRDRGKASKVVFLTSSSGVYNIKREFGRFSSIDAGKIAVGGVSNRRCFDDPEIDVLILNYRSFLLVSDEYKTRTVKSRKTGIARRVLQSKHYKKTGMPIEEWLNGDAGILVLDESHNIANPSARQTETLHLIAPFFEYRYLATGTPADEEQKYYSQLKVLDPALVRGLSYTDWLGEYFELGDRYSPYTVNNIKPHKAEELSNLVKKYCVRRFADDVLLLPQQYTRKYYVEFSEEQRHIYQEIVRTKMNEIQQSFGNLDSKAVVNSFPYLMLALDNPELLLNHTDKMSNSSMIGAIRRFKFLQHHSKIEALKDILDSHPTEKVVIWTSHPSVADKLSSLIKNCLVINGESILPKGMTRDQYKDKIVHEFETRDECRVLIASTQVMNSSITLVAAHIQIVFDSTFNYTEYDQVLSRVYRIGQDKPVFTYILLIDESLDIARNKNLEQKDFVNNNFLKKEYIDLQTAKMLFNMKGE